MDIVFDERFAAANPSLVERPGVIDRFHTGESVLLWIDPDTNSTIVSKSRVLSETGRAQLGRTSRDPGKPKHPSARMIACEPVASPIAEPKLARITGRCLAQQPIPPNGSFKGHEA